MSEISDEEIIKMIGDLREYGGHVTPYGISRAAYPEGQIVNLEKILSARREAEIAARKRAYPTFGE